MPSDSLAEVPVMGAATNLVTAMAIFANRAPNTALVELCLTVLLQALPKKYGPNPSESRPKGKKTLCLDFAGRSAHRFIALCEVSRGFASRGNILRARLLKDGFRAFSPVGVVAMDRKQDTSGFDAALITLCLVFGHSSADKTARNATHR